MSSKVATEDVRRHVMLLEQVEPRMAKADLKRLEEDARSAYGRVIERALQIAGMSKKEAAAALNVDPAQIARWISGQETPQTWRFRSVPKLRRGLLFAEAEDDDTVDVQTTLIVRSA